MGCWTPVERVGDGGDWSAEMVTPDGGRFHVRHHDRIVADVAWEQRGAHNVSNALAAIAAARHAGVEPCVAARALHGFNGVKRRLEHCETVAGIAIYDDFAHHPTAVEAAIDALRKSREGRVIAVLEPASNTMRLGTHRATLGPALSGADDAWVLAPARARWNVHALERAGGTVRVRNDIDTIVRECCEAASPGDAILVMSNADFGGALRPRCEPAQGRESPEGTGVPRPSSTAEPHMTSDIQSASATAARELLEAMPVFALNTVLYPGGPLPLRIFEPRYVDMVSDRLRRNAPFIVALIRAGSEVGGGATTHSVGTLARIVDWDRQDDGLLGIVALGGRRVQVLDTETRPDGLCVATARMLDDEPASAVPAEHRRLLVLLRGLLEQLESRYGRVTPRFDDASWVGYRLSELLPMPLARKQHLLEVEDPLLRLRQLAEVVTALTEGGAQ